MDTYIVTGTLLITGTAVFASVAVTLIVVALFMGDEEEKRILRGIGYLALTIEMIFSVFNQINSDDVVAALAFSVIAMLTGVVTFFLLVWLSPSAIKQRAEEDVRRTANGGSDVMGGHGFDGDGD